MTDDLTADTIREIAKRDRKIEDLQADKAELLRVIEFAISQKMEADTFLSVWREGNWVACKELGFIPNTGANNE